MLEIQIEKEADVTRKHIHIWLLESEEETNGKFIESNSDTSKILSLSAYPNQTGSFSKYVNKIY